VNCSDCYEDQSLIHTPFFGELKYFFTDVLHLEKHQVNDLIFLYIINLNVDNFLTDKLSTGEEFSLSYINCTDEIKEDYRDVTERCSDCDGSGKETCGYCDGSGEWYDREHYYILEEIQYTVLNLGDFKMPGNDAVTDFFQINKDKIYMVINKFYGDVHEETYEGDLPYESNEIIEIESYDNYVRKFGTMDIFKQVNI
jgi:hypothetical protein